jgi:hypothetical protein
MAFVKLDCGILDSSLWHNRDVRDVFITALLMASPHELEHPTEQLDVVSGKPTGWVVPAGWYGFVRAAASAIVVRTVIPDAEGINALRILGEPEPDSRSPDFEGRRLARVAGGFLVLNWRRYRERDMTAAERSRRWRQRKAQQSDDATA